MAFVLDDIMSSSYYHTWHTYHLVVSFVVVEIGNFVVPDSETSRGSLKTFEQRCPGFSIGRLGLNRFARIHVSSGRYAVPCIPIDTFLYIDGAHRHPVPI